MPGTDHLQTRSLAWNDADLSVKGCEVMLFHMLQQEELYQCQARPRMACQTVENPSPGSANVRPPSYPMVANFRSVAQSIGGADVESEFA